MHNHVILPSKLKHTHENHRKTLLTYTFSPVNSYSSVLFHRKLQKDIYLIFLSFSLTLTPNRPLVHFETTLSKWSVSFVLPNSRINSQSSSNLICWHAPHKIQRQMILWLFCSSCQTISFQELKSAYLKSGKTGPCSDFRNTTEKAYPLLQAGFPLFERALCLAQAHLFPEHHMYSMGFWQLVESIMTWMQEGTTYHFICSNNRCFLSVLI